MSRKPRTGDVVEVSWVDSERIHLGWVSAKKYRRAAQRNPEAYRTSGYWLGGVQGRVVVAQNLSLLNQSMADTMSIPEVAVVGIVILGRASKRVRKIYR